MSGDLPAKNKEYGTLQYWESRYSEVTETFDWFKDFAQIKDQTASIFPDKHAKLINLGCGNSLFAVQLVEEGWIDLVNVDYSENCIQYMKTQYPALNWVVCDIFKMDEMFPSDHFDCAIDKGTLDALLTKKHDPWDPSQDILDEIRLYMIQVAKSLKPGGKFIHITFAQPHFRRRFLEFDCFKVKVHALQSENGSFEYFCYEAIKI
jgi:EEF1A lysine methyltransferase 4